MTVQTWAWEKIEDPDDALHAIPLEDEIAREVLGEFVDAAELTTGCPDPMTKAEHWEEFKEAVREARAQAAQS